MPAKDQTGVVFPLIQLGLHATREFAEHIGPLGLTPPQVGMLRVIGGEPGLSQQALAGKLGILPSKVVSFVDDLEEREAVTRTRSMTDRRVHELTLTDEGRRLLNEAMRTAGEHESAFCASLTSEEHRTLAGLLRKLAESHGLAPESHPGYRHFR